MNFRNKISVLTLSTLVSFGANANAFNRLFIDPTDGHFDASQFLLEHDLGFLPTVMLLTEPALGPGLGAAVAIMHESEEQKALRKSGAKDALLPPSMTGVMLAGTENGSKFGGAVHYGHYKNDTIRYRAMAGYGDININLYGLVGDNPNEKFAVKSRAVLTTHELSHRLGDSPWFVGVNASYMDMQTRLRSGESILDDLPLDATNSSYGAQIQYDSLDNIFTPRKGLNAQLKWQQFGKGLGGNFDYQQVTSNNRYYARLSDTVSAAVRLDVTSTKGDVPFFARPHVQMRGIPMMRYQGDHVAVLETQVDWQFHPRWSVLGFVGSGRAANNFGDLANAKDRVAYGTGFRYLLVRQLRLSLGVDIAQGPEDTAVYIGFGSRFN
ncbi:BamA/TamA family outer membrane protein [Paraferrimonas sedimenticola]|uniref:Glyceraldehyde-3-phosphate dehydrogenase n=1 Tax=Paraferrimonas sedimenticola TaxID=375674 RepID=A0AA37RXS9_9GAMM|nr:BamA/TamA family outer membrane protein [Paraferrimonas sedimenticola]GLP97610.1 glyceraldehyde-3-phosphate dehydrogenase [Paraferrimonas sedimenticola]